MRRCTGLRSRLSYFSITGVELHAPGARLCVQRQAAAVRMFLRFFRLGILALEIGDGYVQRLVPESDADCPYVPDCQQPGSRPAMTTRAFQGTDPRFKGAIR